MYCTATENEDGGVQIQMIIDFASRNEYQKKIETICSGNTTDSAITPVINFDYSHSIFERTATYNRRELSHLWICFTGW
ncbi:MAG: hypothetical protein ACLR1V_16250, partial [Coprococcus sp.]